VRAVRRRWLQKHGRPGIAVIERSKRKMGRNFAAIQVDVRIEEPRRNGYRTQLQLPVQIGFAHLVEPGKRVYVRIDPDVKAREREHVALDHGG